MRRTGLTVAAAVAMVLGGLAAPVLPARAAAPVKATSDSRVYSGDFPDPDVISVGPVFWAYGTGTHGLNLQVVSSTDLLKGVKPTEALPTLPAWAVAGRTWAPGVIWLTYAYVMYYTVHDRASGDQCISVATSPTPRGPFVDRSSGPLVCQTNEGGSIDPFPFIAPDGHLYLLWKSDNNSTGLPSSELWAQALAPGGFAVSGQPTVLLGDTSSWEWPVIEAPAMMAIGGRYYVFFDGNLWYTKMSGIGYGVCSSPLGPCTDASPSGAWLATSGAIAGPAGPAPFRSASGGPFLAFNSWGGGVGYPAGTRGVWLAPLGFAAGYRLSGRDGGVFTFGNASYLGSASSTRPGAPVVAIAQTSDGRGYWQVGADGGVFSSGTAGFYGSLAGLRLGAPIVAMLVSPDDRGYGLVSRAGAVYPFGDFGYAGLAGAGAPVVGAASSLFLDGAGYWLARADGTVAASGAAPALGSGHAPVVAIAADPSGIGYWLVGPSGAVSAFGSARAYGSWAGGGTVVAILPTPTGSGYWLVDAKGDVQTFGDAGFAGSLGAHPPVAPITAVAGTAPFLTCSC